MKTQVANEIYRFGMLLCLDIFMCLNPRFLCGKLEKQCLLIHGLDSECVCLEFKGAKVAATSMKLSACCSSTCEQIVSHLVC